MTLGLLADLALFALLLIGVYLQVPRCPECGSIRSQRQPRMNYIRTCLSCQNVYEIRS